MNAFGSTTPPFPTRYPTRAPLVLPRRNRTAITSGWADALSPDSGRSVGSEAERLASHLQEALEERERAVAEAETRLAERTRDLDELEALLRAREALLDSARMRDSGQNGVVTLREAEALHQLRDELERQETSLREARQAMKEREKYLEESEARLFEKVQEQQVKESELEQREEDLGAREARLNGSPAPAKPVYDEFRE